VATRRKGSLWKDCSHEARMLLRLATPLDLTLQRGGLPWSVKQHAANAEVDSLIREQRAAPETPA